MDFDNIMREITAGLTDDPKQNMIYLREQSEKYKDHEMATEILRAIGRLMYSQIPQDKLEEFEKMLDKDKAGIKATLDEVDFNIYKKNYEKALALLDPLIESSKVMFRDDRMSEYHSFDEPFEETLYHYLERPEKDMRPASIPYSHLYLRRASILYELGRHEEAVESCEAALKWNPVCASAYFEMTENKKQLGDMDSYLKLTLDMFKRAFRPQDLAHCYRNLAFWFVEQEMYMEAIGCLFCSLEYEKSQVAQSELFYIQAKTGEELRYPSLEEFQQTAEKYGFPIGPDEDVLNLAYSLGVHCMKKKQYDEARYFLTIVQKLIDSEDVENLLKQIPEA